MLPGTAQQLISSNACVTNEDHVTLMLGLLGDQT